MGVRRCIEPGCDREALADDARCTLHSARLGSSPVTETVAASAECPVIEPEHVLDAGAAPPRQRGWVLGMAWVTAVGAHLLGILYLTASSRSFQLGFANTFDNPTPPPLLTAICDGLSSLWCAALLAAPCLGLAGTLARGSSRGRRLAAVLALGVWLSALVWGSIIVLRR
jgi:hypothetical protein